MVMTASSLKLVVEPELFEFKTGSPVWGPIYITVEDAQSYFPEEHWTDIVLPIMGAWLQMIREMMQHPGEASEVCFMDGPYRAAMKANGDIVRVHLIEDRLNGAVTEQTVDVPLTAIVDNALDVSAITLAACRAAGWEDRDAKALGSIDAELRNAITTLK